MGRISRETIKISQFCHEHAIDMLKEVQLVKEGRSKLAARQRKLVVDSYKQILREGYMLRSGDSMKNYIANRDIMLTGDLIEFASEGIVGRIIRWFTKKQVNHTSMICCLPNYKSITEPHVYIMEAMPEGSELNLLWRVLVKYKGKAYFLKLRASNEQRKKLSDWLLEHDGVDYDYKGLFKNAAGKVSANAQKMFCSELAFLALKSAGIIEGSKAPVPGEFENLGCYYSPTEII